MAAISDAIWVVAKKAAWEATTNWWACAWWVLRPNLIKYVPFLQQFLRTNQGKSGGRVGLKSMGGGQKSRPINGQPANWGWTRVSSIISLWYLSWLWSFLPDRTKEPNDEVRKCIERNNSLVLNGHLRYHGIVNTCCASRVSDHIMSPDGAWVY